MNIESTCLRCGEDFEISDEEQELLNDGQISHDQVSDLCYDCQNEFSPENTDSFEHSDADSGL